MGEPENDADRCETFGNTFVLVSAAVLAAIVVLTLSISSGVPLDGPPIQIPSFGPGYLSPWRMMESLAVIVLFFGLPAIVTFRFVRSRRRSSRLLASGLGVLASPGAWLLFPALLRAPWAAFELVFEIPQTMLELVWVAATGQVHSVEWWSESTMMIVSGVSFLWSVALFGVFLTLLCFTRRTRIGGSQTSSTESAT